MVAHAKVASALPGEGPRQQCARAWVASEPPDAPRRQTVAVALPVTAQPDALGLSSRPAYHGMAARKLDAAESLPNVVFVLVRSPNAQANLRASPAKCERSELPQIARQVQRTLDGSPGAPKSFWQRLG